MYPLFHNLFHFLLKNNNNGLYNGSLGSRKGLHIMYTSAY